MVLLIIAAAGILLLFYLFTKKSEQPVQKVNIQADIQHDEEAEIFLAGGCFWGVQKFLSSLEGVRFTECGYANGMNDNPTYEDVCTKDTGFAECVHVLFDKNELTLEELLNQFYTIIDPVSVNRQGNDIGSQYRTGIYYTNPKDADVIQQSLDKLQKSYDQPLAVEYQSLENFYSAETCHQDYLDKHPDGYCHIPTWKFERKEAAEHHRFPLPDKQELKQRLSAEQYAVTQENATERPYRNAYWDTFEKGIYVDIVSGEPLFVSTDKFVSGCGWPSFTRPIQKDLIKEKSDISGGMRRTEVRSAHSGAHLGHVFDDGPQHCGGMRYCINSAALKFIPIFEMEEKGYGDYMALLQQENQQSAE